MYDPTRTSWPTTEQVRLGRSMAELVRFWPGATEGELRAHDRGGAQFALVDESPDLLVLAYRFGDLEWSDAPFQAQRMTTTGAGWPSGGPAAPVVFRTVLVDSRSGRVLSLRHDEWSVAFSNAVRVSVAEQLVVQPDDQAAGQRLDALYDRFRTPLDMVRAVAVAGCRTEAPMTSGASVHFY
ncbi:hypothetical protein [Nocardioides perillae]|uniref:Uncharacterized protein n=1 Tax=Nocardioides perillae TaxID=1119534 RepID=A0A7Y9RRE0_9ACTN|nr:hypothetical protein [Nocardioides perillae]NYG54940.1 hypothetical protein [Nocardioides perillae]